MEDDHDENNNMMMNMNLPPGFQFCPTDEELVLHFLYREALLLPSHPVIPHLNLRLLDPWQFYGRALSCGNVHYLFSKVTKNKTTENGYWKELDIDHQHHQHDIHTSPGNCRVGVKKYYVFCVGVHPTGTQTRWAMEEYRICKSVFTTSTSTLPNYKTRGKHKLNYNKLVLCRVHERKSSTDSSYHDHEQTFCYGDDDDNGTELSCLDEMFLSLDDDLEEISMQIN
ncbi:hypothetical protein FNV43_RR18891 [Rhamnella rubrinervis]|uniref:NAC domain-containing protein n=1 Tax=Rhamnella rubrinervis TaxID=2594499 RepID=A0A8K0GTC4_9ROSA|nr:hypothetical protein FNV43_RR18891 [Rhamnella rubrinervis]